MGSKIVVVPSNPALEGVGQALAAAIPLPRHDSEERAERDELRKIDIREATPR
jgi:hypothetical protein